MPNLLNTHRDPRFLSDFKIEKTTLSPDGKQVLVYSTDYFNSAFELFDIETGEPISNSPAFYKDYGFRFYKDNATGELFYTSSDGVYAEIKTKDIYQIVIENGALTVQKTPFQFSTKGYYPCLVFTKTQLLVASSEGLQVFDRATNTLIRSLKSPYTADENNGSAISEDGQFVAFADWTSLNITVFKVETGEKISKFTVEAVRDDIGMHLQFTKKQGQLLVAGRQKIAFWDFFTKKNTLNFQVNGVYGASVLEMQLSPDESHLLMIHTGMSVSCYNTETGEQLWLKHQIEGAVSACFSEDSETIFIGKGKRIIKLNAKTSEKTQTRDALSSASLQKLHYLPQQNRLLACTNSQALLLNIETGEIEETLAENAHTFGYNPHIAETQKNFINANSYGASIGNTGGGKQKHILNRYYSNLALNDDFVVSCHAYNSNETKKMLQVYDLEGKNEVCLAKSDKNLPIQGICFMQNSVFLAGVNEKFAAVWNVETHEEIWKTPLKAGYSAKLFTHETAPYIFVKNQKQALTCLNATTGDILWEYEPRKEKTKDKTIKNIELIDVFARNNSVLCLMNNGELRSLNLETGEVLQAQRLCEAGSLRSALAPDSRLFIIQKNMTIETYDVSDWIGASSTVFNLPIKKHEKTAQKPFIIPDISTKITDLAAHFAAANWTDFVPETDAEPLIALLNALENRDGIGEIHHVCTENLLKINENRAQKFFKLTHRYGHFGEMVGFGASPDGRYFATGSWVGDDYDAGGELMIWDVQTGRCVNKMRNVDGGIGWPDYSGSVQWSPDGKMLGLVVNTNGVAAMNPFTEEYDAIDEFYETDGWSRPPQWCWQPEQKAIFIACWAQSAKLPGCVCPIDSKAFPMAKPYGFNAPFDKKLFTKKEIQTSDNQYDSSAISPLTNFSKPKWSSKGFLFGNDRNYAYTLDPQTRALGTVFKDISSNSIWSPDGDFLLQIQEQEIKVYNNQGELLHTIEVGTDLMGDVLKSGNTELEVSIGDDGMPTLLFGRTPIKPIDKVYWHADSEKCLFAAVVFGEFGYLAFYQNFELLGIVKTNIYDIGSWSLGDALAFAFSPDGKRAISLSDDAKMRIWDLENGVNLHKEYAVHEKTKGVFYPANNRFITVHQTELGFYDVETGAETAHYSTQLATDKPDLSYSPLGKIGQNFTINPYFPISHDNKTHWVAAFETGLVICTENIIEKLADELTFTVANRYVWNYNWAKPTILPDLQTALSSDSLPLSAALKTKLAKTFTKKTEKNPADYFLNITKKELFAKKTKKGTIQFSDNSGHFWNDTKKLFQTEELTIAIKKAKDYCTPELFKNDAITAENLRPLLGKVVLYAESYAPSRINIGTLVAISDSYCTVFTIDFNENGQQGSSGSSNSDYNRYVFIGEAKIR